MPTALSSLILCTRGSALALAQARQVAADLTAILRGRPVAINVVKTTGDKLQTMTGAVPAESIPRGLFTKELEEELLAGRAHVAVHSLKDLPTELPDGLRLAATPPRADVREVFLYRDMALRPDPHASEWSPGRRDAFYGGPGISPSSLPTGAVVATSSPRRSAQLRHLNSTIQTVEIRGNVGTRLRKLASQLDLDGTLLAAAGLGRLRLDISPKGLLRVDPRWSAVDRAAVEPPPAGLMATVLEPEVMLPAVGQGAVALEVLADDSETLELCAGLNHSNTFAAVSAERAFLRAMGGGCQSPVAAYGRVVGHLIHLRAVSFHGGTARFAEGRRVVREAEPLGESLAMELKSTRFETQIA